MKKTLIILTVVFLENFSSITTAAVYFNDGNFHLIDFIINDCVYVDQDMAGVGTQIEVSTSGGIAPGEDYGYIVAYGDSRTTISGGKLGWSLCCLDNSKATVKEGAYIRGELATGGNAFVSFENSSVCLAAVATENSALDIKSGYIGRTLELRDNSKVSWSGGTVASFIMSGDAGTHASTCLVTISGSSLSVNGTPLEYGDSVRDFARNGKFSGYTCLTGRITGMLTNNNAINNTFYIFSNSDIIFVPEPATILLLTLGGLVLKRKK